MVICPSGSLWNGVEPALADGVNDDHGHDFLRPRRHADRPEARHHPLDPVRAAETGSDDDPDRGRTDLVHRPAAAVEFRQNTRAEIPPTAPWRCTANALPISDCSRTGVYDGISEVLTTLGESGHRLFVATSKAHVFADRIIDHFGLRPHFAACSAPNSTAPASTNGDLLGYALKEAAVDPAKTLMIGDRSHDMVGAGKNGIRGIGVLYGYGSRDELIGAGARHLCATPAEILGCIS